MPSYVRPGIRKCAKNRALSQVVDQIDETFDTLNTIVEKIPG